MTKTVITIQQTRSPIRRHRTQRQTLIGLGLNRIGRITQVPDTAASRGMIAKVQHLVRLHDNPVLQQSPTIMPAYVDEAGNAAARVRDLAPAQDHDFALMCTLVFPPVIPCGGDWSFHPLVLKTSAMRSHRERNFTSPTHSYRDMTLGCRR